MIKLKKMHLALFFLILSIILITYLFGITGFRTFGSMLLIFFLPAYIIIKKLSIEKDEKVFFSFFNNHLNNIVFLLSGKNNKKHKLSESK